MRPHIGCAGWAFPSAHSPLFSEGDSILARYASRFNAVEINSCFYRSHQRKTYERWATATPDDFRFSVKLPKMITHEQRLQRGGAALDRFVDEVAGLGAKLGGVLVQLPPSLEFEARIVNTFFAMLRRRFSAPIACEPRHATWFTAAADVVWTRYRVSRVVADPELHREPAAAADHVWRYWRWHGSPRVYYSEYSERRLQALAAEVRTTAAAGVRPWVIFDNTAHGHATANAARLQALLAAR